MTFQALRDKLLQHPSSEPLVLNAALVDSDSAIKLWNAILGVPEMTVHEPRIADHNHSVVITGKASFLNIPEMPLEIVFADDHGLLNLRLTAALPQSWTFGQSFPHVSPYFNYDSLNYGYKPSYLNELTFSEPVFVLTTHPYQDAQSAIQFERGLNFLAHMDLLGPLRELNILTGSQAPIRISGLIISDTPTPEFCLSAQLPLRLGDDASVLKLQNIRLNLWSGLTQDHPVAARIEISLQLRIADKVIEIYHPFRVGAPLDFIVIGGRFNDIALPDLGKVAYLVGGDDLASSLPPSLKSFGGITLQEVVTGFSLTGPKLAYVSVGVRTTSAWTIIPNLFEIDGLIMTWLVEQPFQSDQRRISCELEGQIHIADVGFNLYAGWPDFQVGGRLALDSTIKVGALLKHFVPDIPLPDDSLIISQLALMLDPSTKSYQIDARVENVWSLPLGETKLAIESLSLSLAKTPAEQLTGWLTGDMSLQFAGSAHSDLTLSLTALLPSSSARGWQFTGKTGQGQSIPINALIEWLEQRFGLTPRPSSINDFNIANLGISFNTHSKDFLFTCEGEMRLPGLVDKPLQASITIDIQHQQDQAFTKLFSGTLVIDGIEFHLIFESSHLAKGEDTQVFVAAFHDDKGHAVKIDEFINRILATPTDTGLEISLKDALFAYQGSQTNHTSKYLFGLDIEGGLDLSELNLPNLPLLSQPFQPGQSLKLALQVLVASAPFTEEDVTALNKLNGKGLRLPQQVEKDLKLEALLRVGQETKPLSLPIGLSKGKGLVDNSAASTTTQSSPTTVPPGSPTWIPIQKTFGPIHVERVGIGYQTGTISVLLDAALTAAGLTLSLDGLGAEFALAELTQKTFKPVFHLNGLGIDYRNGPVEIGGSFLAHPVTLNGKSYTSYAGLAVIRTTKLTLSAIGSYMQLNDRDPSLFVYAVANYPLGGPAFFYVTGFAAGFGYNRTLNLPPIDQVAAFPLVAQAVKAGGPASLPSGQQEQQARLTDELQQLEQYVPPSVGDIFVAAGIKFTSFKQIDSFALLAVKFGRRFEIDLLGLSTLTAPPPEADKTVAPVAQAQLALKASFIPDEGVLGVRAQLTPNSYILSKDCQLSGGFAFYSWFDPHPQAGDFVLTLGGYHPKFIVPDHYPQVPRLALNWQVNPELHIKADAYFALTGTALMAGGHLQATWQHEALRAWFNAGADFILAWQPYHYDAALYIDMGVSYTFQVFGAHTLTVDLGADLHLWGPEFAGTATVHWSIISFTVNFGAQGSPAMEPIGWERFKASFLPKPEQICSIAVQQGLLRHMHGTEDERWILNAKEMVLAVHSAVPFKHLTVGAHLQLVDADLEKKATHLAIAPMGIEAKDLTSTCVLTVTRKGGQPLEADAFQVWPTWKPMPAALWGKPHFADDQIHLRPPDLNGPQLVENILTGFEIRPKKKTPPPPCQINRQDLQYTTDAVTYPHTWQEMKVEGLRGRDAWKSATETLVGTCQERERLLYAMDLVNAVIDFGEPLDQGNLLVA
jgi:hypothetical protein